jgi:hypothetical protein
MLTRCTSMRVSENDPFPSSRKDLSETYKVSFRTLYDSNLPISYTFKASYVSDLHLCQGQHS